MPAVRITSVCAMPGDGDDRDLLQHHREIERRQELARRDEGKDHNAAEQDDQWNGCRVLMQEPLHLAHEARMLLVKTGDRLRAV